MIPAALLSAVLLLGAPPLGERVGVNIHFTGAPARDLELLADSGLGWVRMDLVWAAVEREKGKYDFEPYDRLLESMEEKGIRLLFILDYSNRLYEKERSIRTPAGRAAFQRFAAAAATRYRGRGIRWEIWNEPNLEQFWTPQPAAADYLALARAVSAAIREADPEARVIGPATSGFPREFLEELFRGGFLECVDEVSVHPYRSTDPETVGADYARLRELIRRHAPPDRSPPPIVSGEWGYSNWHWRKPISPERQGALVARQFLTNIAEGIPLSIWYDWANDGPDPQNREHNFGLVTLERRPKPAFLAVKTLTSVLGSSSFERRLEAPDGSQALLFAEETGRRFLALWTRKESQAIRLRSPVLAGAVQQVSGTGTITRRKPVQGILEVTLTEVPVYLELPANLRALDITAAKGQERVRRLSTREYADRMKGGWIGQMVGVGWGGPTEFRYKGRIIPAAEMPPWKPGLVNQFRQDDIYVEMTFLRTLELHGLEVPVRQAGIDFARSQYRLWHANRAGRDNLRRGIAPPDSGHPRFNQHADDIDYQIEADYSGLLAPGLPEAVIELGEKFGRLMNYGDGLHGGQFVGALYAEAFFSDDPETIVRAGLAAIPARGQYHQCVSDVLRWYREHPEDWERTWERVNKKYHEGPRHRRFSCSGASSDFNIDAKLNGAYIAMGLLHGGGDPDRTITIATRCGQDSDCNPSNAAGVLFTTIGFSRLPGRFRDALDPSQRFSHTPYRFPDLVAVCEKLARQVVLRAGGHIEKGDDGEEILVIPRRQAVPGAAERSWEPGPVAGSRFTAEEMEQISGDQH